MMRLGLLLGDRMHSAERLHGLPNAHLPSGIGNQTDSKYTGFHHHFSSDTFHASQAENTFTSVSSLSSSNENTQEKMLSDASPMSTLTGN